MTHKLVVAALMIREGKILACQRSAKRAMPLKWEFPGGKVEPGENNPEALRRELHEELGIHAEIGVEVTQVVHNYKNGLGVELHFFLVTEWQGEIENLIFQRLRWCHAAALPNLDFLDADRPIVEDLAQGRLLGDLLSPRHSP